MIRRILVGLGDQKYAASATRLAVEVAKGHDAELTGVSVFDPERVGAVGPVPLGAGRSGADLRKHNLAQVCAVIDEVNERFENLCSEAGVAHKVRVPEGDPYRSIADLARYHDLVICGLANFFEHGVADEPPDELVWLVQSGVRPLIAVTPENRPIRRVLVSYSGSMESAKAMKRYAQLRLWPDATVRIVTFEHEREKADELLASAADYYRAHGLYVDTEYRSESPVRGLLAYAGLWRPDLLVLGNSGRNLLLRHVFGETMLHTVRHTSVPLFLAQ